MFKVSLAAFVVGAAAGAGAATYLSSKKPAAAPTSTSPVATASDIALSEEAVAEQTPLPI